jgi:glycerophosphoryl diester phosphodiesterase
MGSLFQEPDPGIARGSAEARAAGIGLDSPDDLKRMIELKVDAITTNRPDVLKRLLDGR